MTDQPVALPYRRFEKDGEWINEAISPTLADRTPRPRDLGRAEAIYFELISEHPEGGYIVDRESREAALLMEQAAAWLRLNTDVTVLGIQFFPPGDCSRSKLILTVEE